MIPLPIKIYKRMFWGCIGGAMLDVVLYWCFSNPVFILASMAFLVGALAYSKTIEILEGEDYE